jgi:hypothetical protein
MPDSDSGDLSAILSPAANTMTIAERYEWLEIIVLEGRSSGNLAAWREDQILEEMDTLWYQMTKEEQAAANERAKRYVKR